MTEIVILPVELSSDGVGRLHAELDRNARAGVDLGPRQGQIACLSASILRSLDSLRDMLARVAAELPPDDPTVSGLQEAAANMTRLARAVVDCAAQFEPNAERTEQA